VKAHRFLAVMLLMGVALATTDSPAVTVERVVAVIGDKAILLTDLHRRARPRLIRMYGQIPDGPQRAAARSQILTAQIQVMVDEELVNTAAARNQQRATAEEVDQALNYAAKVRGMTLSQLFEAVERDTGMSEIEYRQEIRRQVLEGKLLNRFVQNQRVTQAELQEMFELARKQERQILLYNPAWIVLRLGKNAKPQFVEQQAALAQDIVKRVRGGEKFGDLAKQHSADKKTAKHGGNLGVRVPTTSPLAQQGKYKLLARDLEHHAMRLEPGQVSEVFQFSDALVIMTVMARQPSRYTSLKSVQKELGQLVKVQKLQNVKTKWLKDLRRRTHVDVRYP
jgi:peptidyl-prolyl cis-trans isomerase SurA